MTKVVPWVILVAALVVAGWRRRQRQVRRSRAAVPRATLTFLHSTTALIAAREIRQRVRGRIFRVVTVLMLAGVAVAVVVPVVTKGGTSTTRVGVVGALSSDSSGAVVSAGTTLGTHVVLVPEASADTARVDLKAGRIAIAILDARAVLTEKAVAATDTSSTARLAHTIATTVGAEQAIQVAQLTPQQVTQLRNAKPLPLTSVQPARVKGTIRSIAVIGVILLFVLLTQYNTWTLIGVMEEKSSRVVEVLLATVRPIQLLAGKVLGIGLLVFAQAGLIVGFALGLAGLVGSDLLRGAGPVLVLSILIWLVLGYAFYSWVYAAAGSMAERQDQVQSIALPITIPMLVGYVLAIATASSGTPSTFFYVLAYLPPTAPFAMPILVGLRDVTWWQFCASAVITLVSTVGVARLAAHIYRRAVLRTGRRVKLRELFAR
jgi:ABC-2 type transport system permease protein